ncbi:nuclear transcription factor Y subunit B-7 [Trichophyton rubrum]|uniref:Nuclear transcription factor Y subunit B-7 n=1 Tax=Trichophyton rubrum TaxID=5551 RepID=A0A178EWD8_TRIRU|nr:nuclear transcription factor Y subunit B-7 [Trichophyton rubrum]
MSSASPPKEPEVEPVTQSGDEAEPMEREHHDIQTQGQGEFEVKEQDRWLPIANVARIMKTALPENAKIAKEAKECMQECVSEFISFITSEASEKCQGEKRKTVNGEDILFAMTSLGFENYAEALKIYLTKYRETQTARGENQNRPSSSGYGSGGPVGGPAPVPAGMAGTAPAQQPPAGFTVPPPPEASNNLLTGSLDPNEQDGAAYGYPAMTLPGSRRRWQMVRNYNMSTWHLPVPRARHHPDEAAILERIRARRGPNGLLPLDLTLLHSFPVADGWNSFGAIRTRTSIPTAARELAIYRVAAINQAWFEWKQHFPLLKIAGVSDQAIELTKLDTCDEAELARELYSKELIAVYRYSSAMTRNVKVPKDVFQEIKGLFSEKEVVEITATTAAYNCVSRFLVALNVGEMND